MALSRSAAPCAIALLLASSPPALNLPAAYAFGPAKNKSLEGRRNSASSLLLAISPIRASADGV